ncbi:hypothetical protein E4T56_gene7101 [Termitomyces sp. T112]|nr:hypothetical protein E4T56_gene7101 [Termitomyces sp. T112]
MQTFPMPFGIITRIPTPISSLPIHCSKVHTTHTIDPRRLLWIATNTRFDLVADSTPNEMSIYQPIFCSRFSNIFTLWTFFILHGPPVVFGTLSCLALPDVSGQLR